jgi:hypothetical protein
MNQEDQEDQEEQDRDTEIVRYSSVKGKCRKMFEPDRPSGYVNTKFSRSLCRADANIAPMREDVSFQGTKPWKETYKFYRLYDWKVAVPPNMPYSQVEKILFNISRYGPQASGYSIVGSTLMPYYKYD